jgi:nicotinate-nucleotide adenylyltransferase
MLMMTGILGGTFDPIHLGHTHIASQVVTRLGLQRLEFMPCALPVHRGSPHASAQHRCEMIELAIKDTPAFSLNRTELQHSGPSYTIDSLRRIRQSAGFQPAEECLVLILGADAFNGFAGWKAPRQILQLAHLVICCRPGYEVDEELFAEHRVATPEQLWERDVGGILMVAVDAPDCSSSMVRGALKQGFAARQYLTAPVADYIDEHKLYRKECD